MSHCQRLATPRKPARRRFPRRSSCGIAPPGARGCRKRRRSGASYSLTAASSPCPGLEYVPGEGRGWWPAPRHGCSRPAPHAEQPGARPLTSLRHTQVHYIRNQKVASQAVVSHLRATVDHRRFIAIILPYRLRGFPNRTRGDLTFSVVRDPLAAARAPQSRPSAPAHPLSLVPRDALCACRRCRVPRGLPSRRRPSPAASAPRPRRLVPRGGALPARGERRQPGPLCETPRAAAVVLGDAVRRQRRGGGRALPRLLARRPQRTRVGRRALPRVCAHPRLQPRPAPPRGCVLPGP